MTIFQSRFRLAALLLALPLTFSACKKDKDPEPEDDNEQITTVTYVLTPTTAGAPTATFTWRDIDGAGGNAPTITSTNLRANTTYTGAITLSDETKNPMADVTKEVAEESDEHLFIYQSTPPSLLTITRTDLDKNNLQIGLATRVVTNAAGNGTLKITLRHQPGSKTGSETAGDVDVEVTFPVTVQ
ncbi:hypothetical protein [Hymenobacter arizonensis]|uniref:Type 1 periplasmic binding fold superfamily protein n=1 Tax=Hymenobacter arizonensis TaxID=1227077 RepID=A0A1I5XFF5_HYMAR|nr:hypothetical protein [Hymenobacter arizonensis]SFQ30387.1 hypothetical protein SAMN04515668_1797 [Hymenobacter arizonensis]